MKRSHQQKTALLPAIMAAAKPFSKSFGVLIAAAWVAISLSGCAGDSAKSRYLLAEKLWTDGKYAAAVGEFDRVALKDPKGKLGIQALYRSAMTQALYLSQYGDAVLKLKRFVDLNAADSNIAWLAQKEIGEILYSKMEQYDQAIGYYRELLKQRPKAPEAPEFEFRIAKSQFYQWQFSDAVKSYRAIIQKYPKTEWEALSAFEVGTTLYTRGEQGKGGRGLGNEAYQEAMEAFQSFIQKYPKNPRVAEAKFGIASCLEEMDQLNASYHAYQEILSTYPSPDVIKIKLIRIRERQLQKSR